MKYILPLPPVSALTMAMLQNIFRNCKRTNIYTDTDRIRLTTHFVDNANDYNYILNKVAKPAGIVSTDIVNMWNEKDLNYHCCGINFNVIQGRDFLRVHRDYNPTKLNILISGSTKNAVRYIDNQENEYHYWDTPALLDVSQPHYVEEVDDNLAPRVMMQIFLRYKYAVYANLINKNPEW